VSDDLEIRDPAPNPETGLLQEQSAQRVAAAIRRLPVGYRQVIPLMLEELGYGEIADVLGISESNVGARLTRARQMLRELLEEQK
jgi:RNA polymerase sigma-70 factor (ECF subfamily)